MKNLTHTLRILHLEDVPSDAEFVENEIKKGNFNFEMKVVDNKNDFEAALENYIPDIVLADHSLHSFDSIEALEIIKRSGANIPFILVTATMTDQFALSVIQDRGDDYILKDNLSRLPSAITHAMDKSQAQKEKVKADKELRTAQERILFHLENSPLGYIEWDDELSVRSLSRRAEEIFGWNLRQFRENQEAGRDPVYLEDRVWVSSVKEQLISGAIDRKKFRHRSYTRDGRVIWCEWFSSVLKNEAGKVITIMSLVQDITEQKKAEEALTNNELRFREFFETAPEALFVMDPATRAFVDHNDNALKLLKCSAQELLTKSPEGISPAVQPDGRNSSEKIGEYIKCTMNGIHPIFDWLIYDSKGKEIYCEFRLSLLKNVVRPLIRTSVLDITDRVMLERKLVAEKLKNQQEILAAVITAQEKERSFLGEELHDNINQILVTSKLYIEMIIDSPDLRPDLLTASRDFITSAIKEIRKLSKSLLPPSLGEMTLLDALTELIEDFQLVNKFKFIKDWNGIDESLINEKLSLAIFRIVQEQLNNIFKHAQAKTVIIGLEQDNGSLQLRIKDDGIGFDTAEKRQGIGLKNIISRTHLLNGEVIIDSQPGKGCELVVNFKTRLN